MNLWAEMTMRLKHKLNFRKANKSDVRDIWIWRNDTQSRKNSLSTARIPYSSHTKWFRKSLQNRKCQTIIGINAKEKIGLVRCNIKSGGIIEFSIVVNPACRGKGYGKHLLKSVSTRMSKKYTSYIQTAIIKNANKVSEYIFTSVGFAPLHNVARLGYSIWIKDNRGHR